MNRARRAVLRLLGVAPLALVARSAAATTPDGFVSVWTHPTISQDLGVFVDGLFVRDCLGADNREGFVLCHPRGARVRYGGDEHSRVSLPVHRVRIASARISFRRVAPGFQRAAHAHLQLCAVCMDLQRVEPKQPWFTVAPGDVGAGTPGQQCVACAEVRRQVLQRRRMRANDA